FRCLLPLVRPPPLHYTTLFRSGEDRRPERLRQLARIRRHDAEVAALHADGGPRRQGQAVVRGRGERTRAEPRERPVPGGAPPEQDRKSTRLNSSHEWLSYAVFC